MALLVMATTEEIFIALREKIVTYVEESWHALSFTWTAGNELKIYRSSSSNNIGITDTRWSTRCSSKDWLSLSSLLWGEASFSTIGAALQPKSLTFKASASKHEKNLILMEDTNRIVLKNIHLVIKETHFHRSKMFPFFLFFPVPCVREFISRSKSDLSSKWVNYPTMRKVNPSWISTSINYFRDTEINSGRGQMLILWMLCLPIKRKRVRLSRWSARE